MRQEIVVGGRTRHVTVRRQNGRFIVAVDGREWTVDAAPIDGQLWSLIVREADVDRSHEVTIAPGGMPDEVVVGVGPVPVVVSRNGRRRSGRQEDRAQSASGPERVVAPMPGKIVRVLVKEGATVRARQPIIVVEAMKMENELRAGRDGTVAEIHAAEGQSVEAGVLLAVIASQE